MKSFAENRPFIQNEFEQAKFDSDTGMSAEALFEKLQEIQNEETDTPRPLVCARAYAWLLDHVQLEINEHTPFSVKINLGVNYSGFASLDVYDKALYKPQREKILAEGFPVEYGRMRMNESVGVGDVYTDYWHTVPNWPFLLQEGFPGILEKARTAREKMAAKGDCEEKQIVFLDSVILCFEAILRLLNRMYDYSLGFSVPEFSASLHRLISGPPKTLYDVMQFSILYLYAEEIGCERGRTLGPIDQMYWPYMQNDLKNGASMEEIKDLFRYFFLHFTASKRFAQQPFTICGSNADGSDRSNELSLLLLDIYDELNIYDPKIHIRYHQNLDEKILEKAFSMIRSGHSSICLINDEAVYRGYEHLGIPRQDAQDYVILGCYEPVIMGMEDAQIGFSWLNTVKCVEFALCGGKDMQTGKQICQNSPEEIGSFREFFNIYLKHLDELVDFSVEFVQKQDAYAAQINPSPIYSASFPECLEKGMDVHAHAIKYNNVSVPCYGLATSVDSLMMIKKYVYDRKEISLQELRKALAANWQGYEEVRLKIIKDEEKYGNGASGPDAIMEEITRHLGKKYSGMPLKNGGKLRLGLASIHLCIRQGKKTAATPDGRYAGTPVSRNLSPTTGMDRRGITGYMQSFLKINAAHFMNSAIFDFMLHPSAVEGEKGLRDFISLFKIFFAQGGCAVQGNVIGGETLKDAQMHPENYATLQVRVCGWNEYFVKMPKEKQDMFIKTL